MEYRQIPVIIPSYEPDEKLTFLLKKLKLEKMEKIILVDDGSTGEEYQKIYTEAENEYDCIVLHHGVNLGKGRALKTAFNYCIVHFPDMPGCVTIDSDGQHRVKDMTACLNALLENPQSLILGVRNFNQEGIPARSVFGNKCTSRVMKLLTGVSVSDTQTGLRAIPMDFMKELMNEKGERFEFETNMLLATRENGRKITEVPIETIYIEENKTSHFHPLKDSLRIYAVFFKFIFASLSSSVVDLMLFSLFCSLLREKTLMGISYILAATIGARILSAAYNFSINYRVVFKSSHSRGKALCKYVLLAVCIMTASGLAVEYLHSLATVPEVLIKIPVDILLFLVSFMVQREFVYK